MAPNGSADRTGSGAGDWAAVTPTAAAASRLPRAVRIRTDMRPPAFAACGATTIGGADTAAADPGEGEFGKLSLQTQAHGNTAVPIQIHTVESAPFAENS